jgi:pimeloyl-ACP methyl ester carboxylesterase
MNVPYPSIMRDHLMSGNWEQLLKSWYIFAFQLPFVPEALASIADYEGFANTLRSTSNPGSFTEEDIARYKRAWAQPGALTGMLNWYRAMLRQSADRVPAARDSETPKSKPRRITVPTLMLWGEKDVALTKELAQPSIDLCDDGRLIFFPDATHWIQHDEADAVNNHIHDFIQQAETQPG